MLYNINSKASNISEIRCWIQYILFKVDYITSVLNMLNPLEVDCLVKNFISFLKIFIDF